ncbi:MAG: 4-hydroxy-tetrahydrodipicolinate reductase [Candidatus Brocadiia bacterium]
MRVAVNGASGAMGKRVIAAIAGSDDCELVCALEREDHPSIGIDAGAIAGVGKLGLDVTSELQGEPEILIDFSAPDSTLERAAECAREGVALVIGTTGLSDEQTQRIEEEIAAEVPVLMASNMSLGVNLLFRLAEWVAGALQGYDVEIVEAHHRRKKDAPSGTARELGRRVCQGSGRDEDAVIARGHGMVGPREPDEIAIHAVRGGDIVGEHTVIFAGEGERLELTHRASSRDLFARGALQAARFVRSHDPGLYSMQDVIA